MVIGEGAGGGVDCSDLNRKQTPEPSLTMWLVVHLVEIGMVRHQAWNPVQDDQCELSYSWVDDRCRVRVQTTHGRASVETENVIVTSFCCYDDHVHAAVPDLRNAGHESQHDQTAIDEPQPDQHLGPEHL